MLAWVVTTHRSLCHALVCILLFHLDVENTLLNVSEIAYLECHLYKPSYVPALYFLISFWKSLNMLGFTIVLLVLCICVCFCLGCVIAACWWYYAAMLAEAVRVQFFNQRLTIIVWKIFWYWIELIHYWKTVTFVYICTSTYRVALYAFTCR